MQRESSIISRTMSVGLRFACALIALGGIALICSWAPGITFFSYDGDVFRVQDYAYHIALVRQFWFEGFVNIYDLTVQRDMITAQLGQSIPWAMPLGVTPFALIVWLPFAALSQISMTLSYATWASLSFGLLIFALYRVCRQIVETRGHLGLGWLALCGVILLSDTTLAGLALGQTAAFGLALLLLLCLHLVRHTDDVVFPAVLTALLAIKPTYLLLALGALIAFRRWRVLTATSIIGAIFSVGLLVTIGSQWFVDYLTLMGHYGRGEFAEVYRWSIVPGTMTVFATAFAPWLGTPLAYGLSKLCFVGGAIAVLFCALKRSRPGNLTDPAGPLWAVAAMTLLFVLFAPYLGSYEDLLILLPVCCAGMLGFKARLLDPAVALLVLIAFALVINRGLAAELPLACRWIAKATLLSGMMYLLVRKPQPTHVPLQPSAQA